MGYNPSIQPNEIGKEVKQEAKQTISWIKQHERLFIVLLVLIAIVFCFNKYINYDAVKKSEQAVAIQQQLIKDQAVADRIAKQAQQDRQSFLDTINQKEELNNQLLAIIQSDNQQLKQRQQEAKTMPLTDVAVRWAQLVPIQAQDVQSTQSGLTLSETGARLTLSNLEQVPILSDQLKNQIEITTNTQKSLDSCQVFNTSLTNQVSFDKVVLEDTKKKADADISSLKSNQRKTSRNWFIKGLIAGGGIVGYIILR